MNSFLSNEEVNKLADKVWQLLLESDKRKDDNEKHK